jgi:hypothetical protein
MKSDGMQRFLRFLSFLSDKSIDFEIGQQQPDAVMVSFAIIGHRIEVEFFADQVEFSVFRGDEGVDNDLEKLIALVNSNTE